MRFFVGVPSRIDLVAICILFFSRGTCHFLASTSYTGTAVGSFLRENSLRMRSRVNIASVITMAIAAGGGGGGGKKEVTGVSPFSKRSTSSSSAWARASVGGLKGAIK